MKKVSSVFARWISMKPPPPTPADWRLDDVERVHESPPAASIAFPFSSRI
jgi:hypothetical protein